MTRWTERETSDGLVHARRGTPARWDVAVDRTWPVPAPVSRRRIARQVRQDIWRAARGLRGFVPCVMVSAAPGQLSVRAGGTLLAGPAPGLAARLAAILDNQNNRRRWARFARARGSQ